MNLKDRFLTNVRGDILGGLTAGIVSLQLALGFGVASGLENGAVAGLYGAIAIGIVASIFGGTPAQISGPTGLMTVVVAGFAATHSPLLDIAAHRPWIPSLESPENVLEGIYVVHIHGSLFFGNAGPLQQKLGEIQDAKSLIIDMRDVLYLDQSGVYTLSDLIEDMMRRGVAVYLSEMHEEPSEILAELEVAPGTLPVEQIFATVEGAVEKAARQGRW